MKRKKTNRSFLSGTGVFLRLVFFFCFLLLSEKGFSATYYAIETGSGLWSDPTAWSAVSSTGASCGCVPAATDNVIIEGKNVNNTMTVDGVFSITDVTIGSGGGNDKKFATLTVNAAASLTMTGDLQINVGNSGQTYILDAGGGTINVNGTFSYWGTGGQDNITISTGTITFVPVVNLTGGGQNIIFSGAGIINFNNDFTYALDQTSFVTVAGSTVNFAGNYTQNSKNMTFNAASIENFTVTGKTITPNKNIFFGIVNIASSVTTTLASAAGQTEVQGNFTLNSSAAFTANAWTTCAGGNALKCFYVLGDVTLNSGSTFTLNENMKIAGNWTNNGATFSGGGNEVTFEGFGISIGGTSATTFPTLNIGDKVNNINVTLNQNCTCSYLVMDADNSVRTLTFGPSNPTMTVTNDVTINQPTGGFTDLLDVAGGTLTVNGNLVFAGNNNTTNRIGKLNVSSGTFTLSGNVTWMANAVEATEVISLGSGSMTFANSLSMPQQSGTFNITGSGTVNFNGAAAPSFDLNQTSGGVPNAVFSNSFGSTINFNNGFRNANAAVVLADGSTAVFTGSGTVTPSAAITFGNVQINAASTVTLAGNISVTDNWTNLGGTFTPGTNTVTFNGTAAQTITKAGGEIFYSVTSNCTGPVTLANDVTVTNTLTMTAGNYNLNGKTLTLGNAAASSTLSYTNGIAYGGTFRRSWVSGTAVTSTNYGLFPVGTSTDYRPVKIYSGTPTANAYISATHTDAISSTDVSFNEPPLVMRVHNMKSTLSYSANPGGTYSIDVYFTALSSIGTTSDMRLMTYTGAVVGAKGTHAAAGGTVSAPIGKRTSLAGADLQNDWVIGTINSDPVTGTPLRQPYYSIKPSGNWSDATPGNATWSFTYGGPSCDCMPTPGALVVVTTGNPVILNVAASPDYLIIENGSNLVGTSNLTVNYDLQVQGTGYFAPTGGTWAVTKNLTFTGGSSSTTTPAATMTVGQELTMPVGSTLTLGQNFSVSGSVLLDGTIAGGTRTITLNGVSKNISGAGSVTGSGTISVTGDKSILSGSILTFGSSTSSAFSIADAVTTVTNNGTVTLSGNLTGNAAGSTWTNAANSTLNIARALLATGTLDASASPNTVNYNGSVAQTIKNSSTYYNLIASNAATKTSSGTLTVNNGTVTITGAANLSDNGGTITGTASLTMNGTGIFFIGSGGNPGLNLSGTYNLTSGTVNYNRAGNQNVRSVGVNGPAPSAYYNVTFSGSGLKTLYLGGITVQKDLLISGTAQLDASGSNYPISLYGNWTATSTNANPFVERSGTVSLLGSAQQTVSTVLAGGETFYNLITNNSTPAQAIQLSSPVTVSKNLNLTDGHILTTSTNLLTMDAGSTVTLGSTPQDSSFVKGPMAYTVNSSIGTTKTFPVGKNNDYRPIQVFIDQSNNNVTTYTAEMFNSSARTFGYTLPGTLTWVSDVRYHTVTQSPATALDPNQQVRMYYQCTQNTDFVQDPPNLRIAQWDGATAWIDRAGVVGGPPGLCNGTDYAGDILSGTFNTYNGNKFTLANATGGTNPLPIELLSFDAKPNGNVVDVTWKTSSETNSDYFMVQRSKDGNAFEDVEKIKAAGNSTTTRNYSSTDYDPYSGVSYYRLKQVDKDGKYKYSIMIAVNFSASNGIAVYPNPSSGPFNVSVRANAGDEILIVVRDVLGKEFYSKVVILSNDKEVVAIDPDGKLASGVYIVVASSNDTIYEKKIVIQ
ncbi:MAG: T9SS type A sorting domain-containing protein [Bacteroidetes bacterium]|nr:T9SS type A sorting domain-containing protein [Bacteroidota bacterium]